MTPLSTVVVGFGQAAQAFHLPVLADLTARGLATGSVRVVAPLMAAHDLPLPLGAVTHTRIPEPETGDTVMHVCTPPDTHADIVREAHALGYRNFIVEKPMVTSLSDAEDLVRLAGQGRAEILVVTNWSVSDVAAALRRRLQQRGVASVKQLHLVQNKPRFGRTTSDAGHRSAFDVEMPHLVAAGLFLLDGPLEVLHARCADLVLACAEMALRSRHGLRVHLSSDLTAPRRERYAPIEWADGASTTGFFPCDSSDLYGQLFDVAADGHCIARKIVHDDTVSKFFLAAYSYFSGNGPKPASDVRFGSAITQIISSAKALHATNKYHSAINLEVAHAKPFHPAQTVGRR